MTKALVDAQDIAALRIERTDDGRVAFVTYARDEPGQDMRPIAIVRVTPEKAEAAAATIRDLVAEIRG